MLTTVKHDPKDLSRCPMCFAASTRHMGTLRDKVYTDGNHGLGPGGDVEMALKNKAYIESHEDDVRSGKMPIGTMRDGNVVPGKISGEFAPRFNRRLY